MEIFDDRTCTLGEGPGYDERTDRATWVDVPGHRVLWRELGTGATGELRTAGDVSAAIPRESGGLVLLLPTGPALADADGTVVEQIELDEPRAGTEVRCNDGKADPAGRLWFGTLAYDMAVGAGALYRLDPGASSPVRVQSSVTVSNGLGWSPTGDRMYYVDTATMRIDVFDYDLDAGTASGRRPFVDVAPARPDGMCTDADGAVWVALWGAGTIRRYTPDGRLDREVGVPTPYTTSCAFAGPAFDQLIITTASVRKAAGTPEAGLTYVHRPGDVVGAAVHRFAG